MDQDQLERAARLLEDLRDTMDEVRMNLDDDEARQRAWARADAQLHELLPAGDGATPAAGRCRLR